MLKPQSKPVWFQRTGDEGEQTMSVPHHSSRNTVRTSAQIGPYSGGNTRLYALPPKEAISAGEASAEEVRAVWVRTPLSVGETLSFFL